MEKRYRDRLHDYAQLNQCKVKGMITDRERLAKIDEDHLQWINENNAGPSRDYTTGNAIQIHKPYHLKELAYELFEQMKRLIHHDLRLTYWFSTVYGPGDFLAPHTDRPCCSISLSFNVNQIGDDWPIYVWDWPTMNFNSYLTEPGDGVIYSGYNHHYRNMYKGVHYHQLFVHTVLPETIDATDPDTIHTIAASGSFKTIDEREKRFDPNTGELYNEGQEKNYVPIS